MTQHYFLFTSFYHEQNTLYAIRLALYLADFALLYFFSYKLFHKRRFTFLFANICAVAGALIFSLILQNIDGYFDLQGIAFNVGSLLFTLVTMHFLYSDRFIRKAAYALLSHFLLTIADIFNTYLYMALGMDYNLTTYPPPDSHGEFRFIYCAGLKVIDLVVLLIMYRMLKRLMIAGTDKDWAALDYIALILFVGSQIFGLFGMQYYYYSHPYIRHLSFFIASAVMLAEVPVMLRFFPRLYRRFRSDDELIPQFTGEPSGSQDGNAPSVRQLQKLRHDVKNNIVTISALIDSGESAEAKRLLSELGERITVALGGEKATGIAAIDTTLSAKAALCGERGVALDLHAEPLPETKIPPIDLSSAISNILDNAIEAAEKCPEPVITLRIFKYKMYLAIVCENPVSAPPQTIGGRLVTTKDNGGMHGYGTEIVSEICRRNNGRFQFEFTDDKFKAAAFLEI